MRTPRKTWFQAAEKNVAILILGCTCTRCNPPLRSVCNNLGGVYIDGSRRVLNSANSQPVYVSSYFQGLIGWSSSTTVTMRVAGSCLPQRRTRRCGSFCPWQRRGIHINYRKKTARCSSCSLRFKSSPTFTKSNSQAPKARLQSYRDIPAQNRIKI